MTEAIATYPRLSNSRKKPDVVLNQREDGTRERWDEIMYRHRTPIDPWDMEGSM